MSFSKPREVNRNPAKRFLQWKGGDDQGFFQYYDKEKQENIQVDLKEFIVLDNDLFSITGYDEPNKASIISNEVRTINDILVVKRWKDKKSTVELQGPYSQLKDTVKGSRVYKYTRSCYILNLETDEIWHIGLHGFGAYTLSNPEGSGNYMNNVVEIKEIKSDKKGAVKFKYPVFKFGREINGEEAALAHKVDEEILQPYLEKYLSKGADADPVSQHADPKEWRSFKINGKDLCEYKMEDVLNIKQELVEINDVDSDVYAAVEEALREYKNAQLTWRAKKDKEGKPLEDYELHEIQDILSRTPKNHPSKLHLEVAVAEKIAELDIEEDDIPF
jgi:hypothetical protein